MDKLIKFLASFGCVGYLPASGTMASVFPAAIFYLSRNNIPAYSSLTVLSIILAFVFSGRAEKVFKEKDSHKIVIDEVSGMFISFLFLPFKWNYLIMGFIIFRFFDIVKIWPAKRLEKLNGSLGVVLDDVVAGVYTNIILQVINFI